MEIKKINDKIEFETAVQADSRYNEGDNTCASGCVHYIWNSSMGMWIKSNSTQVAKAH